MTNDGGNNVIWAKTEESCAHSKIKAWINCKNLKDGNVYLVLTKSIPPVSKQFPT
jgi:hypothetical protein